MKPMLFRLKITLLSVLLSGVVLIGFGLFSLGVIHRLGVDRIDREIRAFGDRQLSVSRPVEYWAALDRSLRVLRGENRPPPLALQVLTLQGEAIYASSNCPAAMLEAEVPMTQERESGLFTQILTSIYVTWLPVLILPGWIWWVNSTLLRFRR